MPIIYLLQQRLFLGKMDPSWNLVKQGLETSVSQNHGLTNCGWTKSGLLPAFVLSVDISQPPNTQSHGDQRSIRRPRGIFPHSLLVPSNYLPVMPCYHSRSAPAVTYMLRTLLLATCVHKMVESQFREWLFLWATAPIEMAALDLDFTGTDSENDHGSHLEHYLLGSSLLVQSIIILRKSSLDSNKPQNIPSTCNIHPRQTVQNRSRVHSLIT